MPRALTNIYNAGKALMADLDGLSTPSITQAPTNFGEDYSITPGAVLYQVLVTALALDPLQSNVSYSAARVVMTLNFYREDLTGEEDFMNEVMRDAQNTIYNQKNWKAQVGIYQFSEDADPDFEVGERLGNVISFRSTLEVLALDT